MSTEQYFALGIGVGSQNMSGEWLEVFYPQPIYNPDNKLIQDLSALLDYQSGNQTLPLDKNLVGKVSQILAQSQHSALAKLVDNFVNSERPLVVVILADDAAPSTTPEAYLKLHMISHRLVKPHKIDLSGIFPLLPNVAWTNQGAVALDELPEKQLQARLAGNMLEVMSVDKFPKMTNYVVPNGVRIAHTARVRLGAYVGEGTTVMHEGFINFNAGTEGASMIEGRISAGVMVGKGSDLGGGCSTMGTLSGGNDVVISVGENCLIGANAGLGIPLGDRCTLEAGLYLTAGSKVHILDDQNKLVDTVKAKELAGKSDLLFRRNSISGAIECKTNKSAIELNEELHAHN